MIGYSLGDINVLTAIDWMNNVYGSINKIKENKNKLIQVLYTEGNPQNPYEENGIVIIESNNLFETLSHISNELKKLHTKFNDKLDKRKMVENAINQLSNEEIKKFINDSEIRSKITNNLLAPKKIDDNVLIDFYNRIFKITDELSLENGNFAAYNKKLNVILDYLCSFKLQDMTPAVTHLFSSELAHLSRYIGDYRGQSYEAASTWRKRKNDIPDEMKKELLSYCKCFKWSSNLSTLLK